MPKKTIAIPVEVMEFLEELCPEPRMLASDDFPRLAYAMGRRSAYLELAAHRNPHQPEGSPTVITQDEAEKPEPRDWLAEMVERGVRTTGAKP